MAIKKSHVMTEEKAVEKKIKITNPDASATSIEESCATRHTKNIEANAQNEKRRTWFRTLWFSIPLHF